jgi:hypothetical protein
MLQSTLKSDHLLHLIVSAVPKRVILLINELLKDTTAEQREEITGVEKRALVFMLAELLYHDETSKKALQQLAMIAEAETETYDKHATTVFCDYFSPYHPYAPLSLDERLTELKPFALSAKYSLKLRSIGVKAIWRAIDHRSPIIFPSRSEMTLLGPASDETLGSILNYVEGATNLLVKIVESDASSAANDALALLPQANVECIIWVLQLISPGDRLTPVVSRFETLIDWVMADKSISVPDLFNSLKRTSSTLNEDVIKREKITIAELKKSPAGVGKSKSELKKLKEERKQSATALRLYLRQIDQLTEKLTRAFSNRLRIWAGNDWTPEERKEIHSGRDAVQAYDKPRRLAEEAITTPEHLTNDLIRWLCSDKAKRSHIFFRELGKLDSSHQFVEMIQQVGTEERSTMNFACYFEGLNQVNDEFVSKCLDKLSDSGAVPSGAILAATGVIGYNKAGYQRLIKLFAKGNVDSDLAVSALYGDWIERLSPDDCYQLMELIAGSNCEHAVSVLVYLDRWSYRRRPIERQLAELAWSCLEVTPVITDRNDYSYFFDVSSCFDRVASILASTDVERGFELLKRTLKWSDETRSWEDTFYEGEKHWRLLSTQSPHDFWNILWEDGHERAIRFVLNLALEDTAIKYQVTSGLRNVTDQDQDADLLAMLALENASQAELICDSIRIDKPKYLDISLKIIECYPDNQNILGMLKGNFAQEGFEVDIINVSGKYRKEIAELQTDITVPESVQSWLNDLDAYLKNRIDSFNR